MNITKTIQSTTISRDLDLDVPDHPNRMGGDGKTLRNYIYIPLVRLMLLPRLVDNNWFYCWAAASFFFRDSGISGGGGRGRLSATLTPS